MTMMRSEIMGAAQVAFSIEGLPDKIKTAAEKGTSKLVFLLAAHIVSRKLAGQVLKRPTGTLASSVAASPRVITDGVAIVGTVGTNLGYGLEHEYGGQVTHHMPEQVRKISQAFGRAIAPRDVRFRAHRVSYNLPQRSFLRSSLIELERSGVIVNTLRQAVAEAVK